MAKEDFCFTFYDGDATRDASHMNRLERGAYYDLIIAQRKFGHLTLDQIKKVLGKDFEEVWPAIELALKKEGDYYLIEWIEKSLINSRKLSRNQSINGKKGGRPAKDKPDNNPTESQLIPKLNPIESQKKPVIQGQGQGDELENGFKEGGTGETVEPVGIVPEMMQQFAAKNPDYPFDQGTDYPALLEIASKICRWENLPGDLTLPKNTGTVKRRWGELVPFIRADQHYSGYSLTRINKHFQSIAQSFSNGRNQADRSATSGSPGKPGTSEARVRATRDY